MAQSKQKKRLLPRAIRNTFFQIAQHNVGKSAAALTYYMLFAMFPLLIFVSNLLGLLDLNVESITRALMPVLPNDVVNLLATYLHHVTDNSSQTMLVFSLIFSVWFPFRAVRSLMGDVRLAYQLDKPERPVRFAIREVVFTVVFLVIIVVTFLIAVLGRRFVSTVSAFLGLDAFLKIPAVLLNLWQYLRFVLLALIMFAILGLLYAVSQESRQSPKAILPGVGVALLVWLLGSIGFSVYVENFGNYSAIYGTLGAVIVLLIWLYLTSFVLILGAEFNAALDAERRKLREASQQEVTV